MKSFARHIGGTRRAPDFLPTGRRTIDRYKDSPVVSTKVVCDGPGEQRALHVKAATA
jgi:hypothetical protein